MRFGSKLRELSLFTGAGGGLLGTKLLGFKHVGYVEINDYCQRVIAQRIKDGILDEAPIFGDIKTFLSEGYAASYKGMVDVVTGGPPCQPFSFAGKRLGEKDDRDMWPATLECIRIIRPRYIFLENPPSLLTYREVQRIFGELAESGYCVRWRCLSAAEMGAPHLRDRVWIMAHTDCSSGCAELGEQQSQRPEVSTGSGAEENSAADPEKQGLQRHESKRDTRDDGCLTQCNWWSTEPRLDRVGNGMANRMDRIRAIGNGQVPAVVKAAWKLLTHDL